MSETAARERNEVPATAALSQRVASLIGALGPLFALLMVIAVFAVADWLQEGRDTFLTPRNARTIAVQAAPVVVAALGMTVIIIAGGIDLSAGTATCACGHGAGLVSQQGIFGPGGRGGRDRHWVPGGIHQRRACQLASRRSIHHHAGDDDDLSRRGADNRGQ